MRIQESSLSSFAPLLDSLPPLYSCTATNCHHSNTSILYKLLSIIQTISPVQEVVLFLHITANHHNMSL